MSLTKEGIIKIILDAREERRSKQQRLDEELSKVTERIFSKMETDIRYYEQLGNPVSSYSFNITPFIEGLANNKLFDYKASEKFKQELIPVCGKLGLVVGIRGDLVDVDWSELSKKANIAEIKGILQHG